MILRATILFVAAAAIAAVAANTRQKKKPKDPPREAEEEDEDDEEEKFVCAISSIWSEAEEKIVAQDIEHRKEAFETKLLDHKEKKSRVVALRRDLEEKIGQIGKLGFKVKCLEAEMDDLAVKQSKLRLEEIREVELANKTAQQLQKRLRLEADSNRVVVDKMKVIQERVSAIQDGELCQSERDAWVDGKLRGIELEMLRMKRKNKELEMEKRVLSLKLLVSQESRAKSKLPILDERKAVLPELQEELTTVKRENDELLNQIDTLQKSRFSMVEELVYHRRIHACLKFDFSGKPWRSQSSPHSETDYNDSSGRSSPAIKQRRSSMESSTDLIRKIKNWGKRKNDSRARRFSTSTIPSRRSSVLGEDSGEAGELKNRGIAETVKPRKRRVSFNDHVSIFELKHESCAEELWGREPESRSDTEYSTATPPGSEIGIDKVVRLSAGTDFEIYEHEGEEETKLNDDMVSASESEVGFDSRVTSVSLPDQTAVVYVFFWFWFVVVLVVGLTRLLLSGK